MKSFSLLFLFLLSIFSIAQNIEDDLTQHVDPFIGTGGHGHTFPGATVPFGMVQLSPDTRLTGWDGCSGYHYTDSLVYGFSHTHLSGTGVSDYGDVLLMPYTDETYYSNGSTIMVQMANQVIAHLLKKKTKKLNQVITRLTLKKMIFWLN